jgi:hypothetical protein
MGIWGVHHQVCEKLALEASFKKVGEVTASSKRGEVTDQVFCTGQRRQTKRLLRHRQGYQHLQRWRLEEFLVF